MRPGTTRRRWAAPIGLLAAVVCLLAGVEARAGDAPLVLGHRGDRAHAPANSLAAFRSAARVGADGVELDVRMASTGELVLVHDRKVELPSGKRALVSKLTFDELRSIDLGGGERIPTLAEGLQAIDRRMLVNIEVKLESLRSRGIERKVIEEVRRRGMAGRVILSSFNPFSVRRMKRLAPDMRVAQVVRADFTARLAMAISRVPEVNPDVRLVDRRRVDRWRQRGIRRITPWTVNAPAAIRRMATLGVEALITDDPARARRLLRHRARTRPTGRAPRR